MCSRALARKPNVHPTINSVSVQLVFALKSPNQRRANETRSAGAHAPNVSQVSRVSCERRRRGLRSCFISRAPALVLLLVIVLVIEKLRSTGHEHDYEHEHEKSSQPMLLKTTVKCAPAQAERFRRLARVAIVSGERFLDQERLHFLETHLLQARRAIGRTR